MIPDFGWAYVTPGFPPATCRWCNRGLVEVQCLHVCPQCDFVAKWPNVSGSR